MARRRRRRREPFRGPGYEDSGPGYRSETGKHEQPGPISDAERRQIENYKRRRRRRRRPGIWYPDGTTRA